MSGLVAGKVALVTGAGAGIGRAAALKFAEDGAKVVVSDVNCNGGNETVALIRQKGRDAVFTRADVTIAAEVEGLVANAVAVWPLRTHAQPLPKRLRKPEKLSITKSRVQEKNKLRVRRGKSKAPAGTRAVDGMF